MMCMIVNKNDKIFIDMKSNWNLNNNVYKSEFTVNELIDSICVFERLQKKYPNDDVIEASIEILRDEICKLFGGSIYIDCE